MSAELTHAMSAACRRMLKSRPAFALMAARLSGDDSLRPTEHRGAAMLMAREFYQAGWKPRLRVKAGRREWSLPCPE